MGLSIEQSLRQICRLVFADRLFGDEVVAITLNRLARAGKGDAPANDLVTGLLTFFDLWTAAHESSSPPPFFSDEALFKSLGPPLPPGRIALLLKDILNVADRDIAHIVHTPESDIEDLIAAGRASFVNQAAGCVAILEAEPQLATQFVALIENLGATPLIPAQTADQARRLLEIEKPDLIIADDSTSARHAAGDAVKSSRDIHDCTVLLITDRPEHALEGKSDEPDIVLGNTYSYHAIRTAIAHCLSTDRAQITY